MVGQHVADRLCDGGRGWAGVDRCGERERRRKAAALTTFLSWQWREGEIGLGGDHSIFAFWIVWPSCGERERRRKREESLGSGEMETSISLRGRDGVGRGSKRLPRRLSCLAVERGRGEGRGGIC
ncbi:hypothetical protein AAC387_Pa05g1099 [Persea americana]